MAYLINRYSGAQLLVLEDGTIDVTTSLTLVGRNYTGYGEIQNENFLYLLENFANDAPPPRPLSGQVWYNDSTKNLSVYDGTVWKTVGSATVSEVAPAEAEGALWLNSNNNQLYVFNGQWNVIGPEAITGFGITKLRSRTVKDIFDGEHAVSELIVDDEIIAIVSKDEFTVSLVDFIDGFTSLKKGINFSNKKTDSTFDYQLNGDVRGNAETASRFKTPITINGVQFDGQSNVIVKSSTTNFLRKGEYITGSDFDGSAEQTWSVNATPNNTIGTVVARDSSGDFSAGNITANLIGNLTGNVNAVSGTSTFDVISANRVIGATFSGNAETANILRTARLINGVSFNGGADITVPASAETLTGGFIKNTVLYSSLQSVGILNGVKVDDLGAIIGDNDVLKIYVDSTENGVIKSQIAGKGLKIEVADTVSGTGVSRVQFVPSSVSLSLGGSNNPGIIPEESSLYNLGIPTKKWKNVYSDFLIGTATTAQYADLAEKYTADADYQPGTVLMFGGESEVTIAEEETARIAGVVSTNPAYLMNSELHATYTAAVALQGRVPCIVKGPVRKGDMLVSAGDGKAKVSENPKIGTVIGKALADFDGVEGVIEVVVGRL